MSQVNLKTKSTVELKALAYDISVLINNYNQTLQVVNQEIGERNQQEQQKQAVENVKPLQAVPKKEAAETIEAEVVQ